MPYDITIPSLEGVAVPQLVLPPDFPAPPAGKTRVFLYPTVPVSEEEPDGDGRSIAWADPQGRWPGTGINLKWHVHPLDTSSSTAVWRGFSRPAYVQEIFKVYAVIYGEQQLARNVTVGFGWGGYTDASWADASTFGNDRKRRTLWWDISSHPTPNTYDFERLAILSYIDATLTDFSGDQLSEVLVHGVAVIIDALIDEGMIILPYLKIPQGQGQQVTELDGHSSISELACETIDKRGEIKTLAADPNVLGALVRYRMGFKGMSLGDFVVLHTDQIVDLGSSEEGWMEWRLQDIQRSTIDQIWQNGGPAPYTLYQLAPEPPLRNGFLANAVANFEDNPRYLQGNPLDILLVALQNELGIGQANTDPKSWLIYDPDRPLKKYSGKYAPVLPHTPIYFSTLLNPNLYVDVDRIVALRDRDFSGDRMEFKLTRPVSGKQWIDDQILKPLGLFWIIRPDGRLAIKTMKGPEVITEEIWTQDNVIGIPAPVRLPPINVVTVRFEVDDTNRETAARQFEKEVTFKETDSIAQYHGQEFIQQVEANGLRVLSGGMLRAQILANRIFRRHAFGTIEYSIKTFIKNMRPEIGDYILLSHPKVVDLINGVRGISNVRCEVVDRQPDYASGQMNWKLWDTRSMRFSTPFYIMKYGAITIAGYKIAPVTVPAWTSASAEEKAKYMFACDVTTLEYSDSTPGHLIAGGSVVSQQAAYSIEFAPHNMTSDVLPSPYVASASSFFTGLDAFHAFDGSLATGHAWVGTGSGVDWLKLDLGSGNTKVMFSYAIQVAAGYVTRAPKDWTLEGSNDDSLWDALDTQTNQTGWASALKQTFALAAPVAAYRYFRLNITANNGDPTYTEVDELYLDASTVLPSQRAKYMFISDAATGAYSNGDAGHTIF